MLLIGAFSAVLAGPGRAIAQSAQRPAVAPTPISSPTVTSPSPEALALALATPIARAYVESLRAETAGQKIDITEYPIFQTAPFTAPTLATRLSPWIEIFRQASLQTLAEREPQLVALLARTLASQLSLDELKTAAKFMNGPGGAYVVKIFAHEQPVPVIPDGLKSSKSGLDSNAVIATLNAVSSKAHGPLPPPAAAALADLKKTETGRALVKDLVASATWKDAKRDYFEIFIPRLMVHAADGLEADQETRQAAEAGAPSPDALALGISVVHGAYASLDDKAWAQINAAMASISTKPPKDNFNEASLPPKWPSIMVAAFIDTLHYDQPMIEKSFGRALARLYSTEDLKVLADFMNGPAPAYFLKQQLAGTSGSSHNSQPPPEVLASVARFSKSGVAGRLKTRLQDTDKDTMFTIGVDVVLPFATHFMRRFGEKADTFDSYPAPASGR